MPQTIKRYEEGFQYLHQLAKSLKITKNKRERYSLALDEISQTIKGEKREFENSMNKVNSVMSKSSPYVLLKSQDSKRNSNQNYNNKGENTTDYVLKINDQIVREKNVMEFSIKNHPIKTRSSDSPYSDKKKISCSINSFNSASCASYKPKEFQNEQYNSNSNFLICSNNDNLIGMKKKPNTTICSNLWKNSTFSRSMIRISYNLKIKALPNLSCKIKEKTDNYC